MNRPSKRRGQETSDAGGMCVIMRLNSTFWVNRQSLGITRTLQILPKLYVNLAIIKVKFNRS